MNLFKKIFRALNKAKIKYLVVGGVAVNLHGYIRFTGDLDILLLLEDQNLKKMYKVMKKLKYSERLPVSILELKDRKQVKKWLKEKGMQAFSFNPPKDNPLQLDIVIEESLKFDKIFPKRITKRISDVSIPVISIQDLIKMKKKTNRWQDLIDIENLIKLKNL